MFFGENTKHYVRDKNNKHYILTCSFLLFLRYENPCVAWLCASNLAKHIKKITSSFGVDYFLPLP